MRLGFFFFVFFLFGRRIVSFRQIVYWLSRRQYLINGEVEHANGAFLICPLSLLGAFQIFTVFTVVKALLVAPAVDEAAVVLA